jgi:8-oxo-dGTP diphosphatase
MAKKKQSGDFQRMAVAADGVILTYDEKKIKVLLIKRGNAPFKGEWALPGGFVGEGESAEECAQREIGEETGLRKLSLEQLCTVSEPKRDPRGRVISVVYISYFKSGKAGAVAGDDATDAEWYPINKLPKLGFDHSKIVKLASKKLKDLLNYQGAAFELLPEKFTFSQLQSVYEEALELELDKRNFRRRFINSGLVIALNELEKNVPYKPGRYYKLDRKLLKSEPGLMPVF